MLAQTVVSLRAKATPRPQLDLPTWTERRRSIRGLPFRIPPPLQAVYANTAREMVLTKAAQVGASEYAINVALWVADTMQGGRGRSLYILPAREQAGDFVRARIDTAVEESTYLQERVKPRQGLQPSKTADNVGLKRVGNGFLFVRGSNAEAGLVSIDADCCLYDEVDRLRVGTLAFGAKRLGSSLLAWQRYISTPIYPEVGIDALWLKSTRNRWHLRCEHCGERQSLVFPDNVREDGAVICRACHKPIDRLAPGEWVPENPQADIAGYQLSKLFGERSDVLTLAKLGYRILNRDETDPSVIQQFYNQDLGLPHAPEGGQLSRAELSACIADYSLDDWAPTGCTMGVDVGAKLHIVVSAPSPENAGKRRLAFAGAAHDWSVLDALMPRFDVSCCVVDAEPEHHKAREFANRWPGRVWLCHYPNTSTWVHQEPVVWKDDEQSVSAHRTITLDGLFAEIRERRIEYPREVLHLPEFSEQMMAPVRVVEKAASGNMVARYVEGGKADHMCHSHNYERIARLRSAAPTITPGMLTITAGRRQ